MVQRRIGEIPGSPRAVKAAAVMALAGVAAALGLLGGQGVADAQGIYYGRDDYTAIALGGTIVMKMRTGAGGYTPEERADIIRDRIKAVIRETPSLRADEITMRSGQNDEWIGIYARDQLLVTITDSLARANNTSKEVLARLYLQRLQAVLPSVTPESWYHLHKVLRAGR